MKHEFYPLEFSIQHHHKFNIDFSVLSTTIKWTIFLVLEKLKMQF